MEERITRFALIFIFAVIATLVDGGIGMGYGVSLTSLLLSIGVGTAVASAAVHVSEVVTSLVSGVSHFLLGNFDQKIFTFLAIPGIFGGVLGAYGAVQLAENTFTRPIVAGVLFTLGVLIVIKFTRKKEFLDAEYNRPRVRHLMPLGFIAAFIDAIGGGGWGPITTPTLVLRNANPQHVIGSVNLAEFFVAFSIATTFFLTLPMIDLAIVLPMIIAGIIAAPLGALITKRLPVRSIGIIVGIIIIILSARTLLISIL
jgi:uncharacterized membrane protein YfcA